MVNKVKYTPKPWHTIPCSAGGKLLVRGEDHCKHVQHMIQIVPSEDAVLMAAAPEMLEALKAMLLHFAVGETTEGCAEQRARMAIAKAEGSK